MHFSLSIYCKVLVRSAFRHKINTISGGRKSYQSLEATNIKLLNQKYFLFPVNVFKTILNTCAVPCGSPYSYVITDHLKEASPN